MGLAAAISIFNSFTNQTLGESTIEKHPLAKAAFQGDLAQLEAALNVGAAVNGRDEQNSTALHWASNPEGILKFPEGDHVACVRKLIAAGADVNAENGSSETPLYRAVFRSKIAGILLQHGADPNKGQLTRTPLISAAFMGGAGCAEGLRSMELLVGAGADVNAQEAGISNALTTAGIYGCPQMIEFLIGHGAEVNARFANGETPLGFMKRYETIAEGSIFTRAGADVRLRNTMLIRRAGGID